MPLLKKALGLSIIGITIVILAMSYYINRKELNPEWNNAITLQWIDSNEVPISELNNQSLSDLFEDFPEWSLNYQFEELNDMSLNTFFNNHLTLVNSVVNGDFNQVSNFNNYLTTYTVSNNIATVKNNSSVSATNPAIYQDIPTTSGDKVYFYANVRTTNSDALSVGFRFNNPTTYRWINSPILNQWYENSVLITSISTFIRMLLSHNFSSTTIAANKEMQVKNVYAINMTALGIESYTEAQMLDLVQLGYFTSKNFTALEIYENVNNPINIINDINNTNLTQERLDYYFNIYQLMLENQSTDDIEFIQMLTDYAEEFNVTYEQMETYYQNYYDNAYFNNQSVDISLEDYNFIEQGSGVIEAIYTPIVNMIDTITTISDRVTKFFGIKEQTTINYYDYSTLYEEFELNQIFGRKIYTYDISTTQQIQYSLDLNSYRLVTYYMILGVRVWEINTEVLTYARLDELNEIYEWIDLA
jgi:hypothetical protein